MIGCLLFLFCIIVDGVDGEIARLKLEESEFGHKLDIITDNIVHASIFSGLGFGYYAQTGDPVYLDLLWILLGGFALSGTTFYYRLFRNSSTELRSNRVTHILTLLSNRDFAYLMVILSALGRLHWFLVGSAIGSYIFAVVLWLSTSNGKIVNVPAEAGPDTETK